MKHLSLAFAVFAVMSSLAGAGLAARPHFQIDGTVGTRFGGSKAVDLEDDRGVDVGEGQFSTDSALAWGILASYQIQSNGSVFLNYSRQETTFRVRTDAYSDGEWINDEMSGDGSIEYFQFGGNLQAPTKILIPYLGVSIGLTRMASLEDNGGDWARFNVTIDGGFRLEIVPLLDIRVIGRVPFTFPSTDLYCFSGRGCAVISHSSPFVQGELQVGLGLRF